MTGGALNLAWSAALVEELARGGVREACVSPGSRSTPLVLALHATPEIRVHVHPDERCAGFFALGAGRATGRPALVVTTSGTAVANLLPAVVEADRSGVPLLLLTADRPGRLHGTDANQTVDQRRIFGDRVRLFHQVTAPGETERDVRYLRSLAGRALGAALGRPAGPVHLNLPFAKPLEPDPRPAAGGTTSTTRRTRGAPDPGGAEAEASGSDRGEGRPYTRVAPTVRRLTSETLASLAGRISGTVRGLLVCGPSPRPDRMGPAALRLARASGWPLLADPLSGARFRPGAEELALGGYDLFLREEALRKRLAPELVLRLGPAPTSAVLQGYLECHARAEQVVLDDLPVWPDHGFLASEVLAAEPVTAAGELAGALAGGGGAPVGPWTRLWRRAEEVALRAAEGELAGAFFEGSILAAVAAHLPEDALLFVGSSMPVRDLDAFGAPRDRPLEVIGNRGASGIDGSVSTALGAAVASGRPAAAVLGDLALYHDMNGLLAAKRMERPVALVVVQNDGGGIFHFLPVRSYDPPFTDCFATPHGLDPERVAALYGLDFARIAGKTGEAVGRALAGEIGRTFAGRAVRLIEVRSNREGNRRRRLEAVERVRRAVGEIADAPA